MKSIKIITPFLLSISLLSCGSPQEEAEAYRSPIETSINHPTLQIFELDGRLLRMNEFEGKPYVITFWNTKNQQSTEGLKALEIIKKELGGELIVLALSEEPAFKQIQYKNSHKHPFRFLKTKFPKEISKLPTLQLYDKKHNLVKELTTVNKTELEALLHE